MNEDFQKAQKLRDNGQIDEAIELYQKIGDAESIHMIGVCYYQDRKFKKANEYLEKALKKFEEEKSSEFTGFVLRDLGIVARGQKDFEKAEKFLNESIEKLKEIGNKGHEGMSHVKLGSVFADQEKFDEAFSEINKGIELLQQSDEKFFLSSAYLDRAKVDAKKSLDVLDSFAKPDEFLERRKCLKNFL